MFISNPSKKPPCKINQYQKGGKNGGKGKDKGKNGGKHNDKKDEDNSSRTVNNVNSTIGVEQSIWSKLPQEERNIINDHSKKVKNSNKNNTNQNATDNQSRRATIVCIMEQNEEDR